MINNNLTKEFDINALWSINKGLSDERVVGTLTVAKNEMILELPNIDLDFDEKFKSIIGQTQSKIISLFNLRVIRNYTKNIKYTELLVEYMIVDSKPIEKLEDLKLKSVQFSFDLLPLFFGKSAWKTDRETESLIKDSIESKTHNIDCLEATLTEKYRSPDQSEITPENGLVITLRTHPYFELQYSEKKSIIKIQQDIFKIRNLLSIICGEALTVSYASYESKTIDIGGNPMPFYGQFYFDQTDVTRRANQVTSALHS